MPPSGQVVLPTGVRLSPTVRHRINAAFARLALRSREAAHPVAEHYGVHALANVQQAVAVNVEAGVTREPPRCRGKRLKGSDSTSQGVQAFLPGSIDEGVVVHGEEQDCHQGERLKHGEPASMTMVRGLVVLFVLQFFSLGSGCDPLGLQMFA